MDYEQIDLYHEPVLSDDEVDNGWDDYNREYMYPELSEDDDVE